VRPFRYIRPRAVSEVFDVLAKEGAAAKLLAGGTDLLVRLRLGHVRPAVVVDLKHLSGLSPEIRLTDGVVRIGATAVMTDVLGDARVRTHFPALVEAASVVGSVQIRNRATVAGNICNASPAADTAPALLAYGARVNLVGVAGPRQVPLSGFFTGPGRTVMNAGELVESIDLPVPATETGAAFGRITRRYGVDLATINLCCLVTRSGVTRFAFGAVGPRPFVVEDATGTLASSTSGAEARDAVLAGILAQASPISDIRAGREYRQAMLGVMSRRTLDAALARRRGQA
jgi:carbon-monoxide dehydrogenase medium subunit